MPEFNLVDEKWIPCVMISASDNSNQAVRESFGLQDVLIKARDITEIVGENPLITISLYRLLLAILHDIFQGPKDADEWESIWKKICFDEDLIKNYFIENYENFFLFHDEKPFYQVSKFILASKIIEPEIGSKLIKPISNFYMAGEGVATLFEHSNSEKPMRLGFDFAARILLMFQNFDVGGAKTRDTTGLTKKEKSLITSADAALLNTCAVCLVKDKSLFKTLMLNLTQYNKEFGIPFPKRTVTNDLPIWRNSEKINPNEDKTKFYYLDLLTWQSRQIKLFQNIHKGEKVVENVVVMKGNQISQLGELHGKEQMVAFEIREKLIEEGDKKVKRKVWSPISFQEDRALWRDSISIFQSIGERSRPEILNWLSDLVGKGKLEKDKVFPLDFFGLSVNKAKPLFWRHERLPMPLKYLSDFELCGELREALKFAETTAYLLNDSIYRASTLYYLPESRFEVGNWFKPFCSKEVANAFEEYKKGKNVKDKFKVSKGKPVGEIPLLVKTLAPKLRYWSRLENPFRRHLLELAKGKSVWKSQRENWANEVLGKTVFLAFSEAVQNLGNSPNALRAVSISQSWLEAEFNWRKKKFLNFESLGDDEQETVENEEEEIE